MTDKPYVLVMHNGKEVKVRKHPVSKGYRWGFPPATHAASPVLYITLADFDLIEEGVEAGADMVTRFSNRGDHIKNQTKIIDHLLKKGFIKPDNDVVKN